MSDNTADLAAAAWDENTTDDDDEPADELPVAEMRAEPIDEQPTDAAPAGERTPPAPSNPGEPAASPSVAPAGAASVDPEPLPMVDDPLEGKLWKGRRAPKGYRKRPDGTLTRKVDGAPKLAAPRPEPQSTAPLPPMGNESPLEETKPDEIAAPAKPPAWERFVAYLDVVLNRPHAQIVKAQRDNDRAALALVRTGFGMLELFTGMDDGAPDFRNIMVPSTMRARPNGDIEFTLPSTLENHAAAIIADLTGALGVGGGGHPLMLAVFNAIALGGAFVALAKGRIPVPRKGAPRIPSEVVVMSEAQLEQIVSASEPSAAN